jgi:Protein of unknown function (DUF3300)
MVVRSISEEKMLGWTIGISRRGIAASLACIAIGGVAFAQDMLPNPAPSTTPATPAPNAAAAPPATSPAQLLTQAQLAQLVAPIALYPDPLLAQILMASTYPLEVGRGRALGQRSGEPGADRRSADQRAAGAELGPQRQGAGAVPAGSGEYEQATAMDRGTWQRLSRPAG